MHECPERAVCDPREANDLTCVMVGAKVLRGSGTAELRSPLYASPLTMAGLRNSGYSEDYLNRERPLVVKCTFYDKKRRITFNAAKNCSCDILRQKVRDNFTG